MPENPNPEWNCWYCSSTVVQVDKDKASVKMEEVDIGKDGGMENDGKEGQRSCFFNGGKK